MTALLIGGWLLLLVLAGCFGYFVWGPWSDGYKPFTSPDTAADDRVWGTHPERRLSRWRP